MTRVKTTIKDIARAAGVSVATVSMALNRRAGISEKTRKKVLKVAEELCYVPDDSARSLVMKGGNLIGLLIPEIQNPFYSAVVDIMTRLAEEKRFVLLLAISNNDSRQEAEAIRMFLSRRVNGIVIVPVLRDDPDTSHLALLRGAGVPTVFCTESYAGCEEPVVECDFEDGQYRMTQYILSRGIRKTCFVSTSMRTPFALLRYEGYVRALEEAGIPVDPANVFLLEHPRYLSAYNATDALLERKPEAILCINDIMTIGILKRLMERGVEIPEQLSVAGFDDMMFSELVSKPLTTVRQPLEEICQKTFAILLRKIEAGDDQRSIEKFAIHRLKPELVIRATTR